MRKESTQSSAVNVKVSYPQSKNRPKGSVKNKPKGRNR